MSPRRAKVKVKVKVKVRVRVMDTGVSPCRLFAGGVGLGTPIGQKASPFQK